MQFAESICPSQENNSSAEPSGDALSSNIVPEENKGEYLYEDLEIGSRYDYHTTYEHGHGGQERLG
jgi:hypothetical protein